MRYSLHELSGSVSNEKHSALSFAVYRPGEEGHYWYAVISGSLEMLDVDPDDSDKVYSLTTSLYHMTISTISHGHPHFVILPEDI